MGDRSASCPLARCFEKSLEWNLFFFFFLALAQYKALCSTLESLSDSSGCCTKQYEQGRVSSDFHLDRGV